MAAQGADPKAPAAGSPSSAKWCTELDMAARAHKDFLDDGRKVVDRYWSEAADTKRRGGQRRLNILYSNTEVLRSALYGKAAKPDVRRRFADRDAVGQGVAQIIERALTYFGDVGDVDSPIEAALLESLLPGRGVVRVEYEPVIAGEEGAEYLVDQKLRDVHVFWEDFLCGAARTWDKVPWIAFRHTLDADGLGGVLSGAPPSSEVYAQSVEAIPMTWTPDLGGKDVPEDAKKAEVWEVWDKASRTRLWVVKGYPVPLRVDQDPYELTGFWPMPRPLTSYSTTSSVIPKAEFAAYQDQADDLDELTRRISVLTKAMKRRGVYNQALKELRRLASAGDNEFVAVEKWGELATKGGLDAQFQVEDISNTARLLLELYKQRDMLVQAIYEITGISDVARGASDPDETLGAQQLKASFGSQRIKRRQKQIERWIRDLYRIKAELILSHFDPQILAQIANTPLSPQLIQALQNETLVSFAVDIETDSTVFQDAVQAQQARAQLLQGVTQLWQAWAPIVKEKPQLAPLLFQLTRFGIAPAQDARMVEDALDQAEQTLQQAMGPGAPPDPQAAAEQAKTQAEQVKAQAEQVKAQGSIQVAQISASAELAKAQAETQRTAMQLQANREAHVQDAANRQHEHDLTVAHMIQKHGVEMQRQAMQAPAATAGGAPQAGPQPPVPGARQAPDGHFYVEASHAHGRFHRVTAHA